MKKLFKKIYYIGGTVYRGLIGIFDNLFDAEEKISNEVDREVIGKTVKGKDIICYKITGSFVPTDVETHDDNPKKLLIVGGIHGNEVGTVKLAKKIINYFLNKKINIELFVIPVLNIDGYGQALKNPDYIHRGKICRFNANNVDLNRN